MYAGEQADRLGTVTRAPEPQKTTQLDQMRREAERATVRAAELRRRLTQIGERLVGPVPQNEARQAGEAISQAGFIPGTSFALERLHIELTGIEDLLTGFEQTV